ncbi:hypothetical protein J9253_01150 [Thiothrix litoralis]|uniref:Uncharacterized protein n=1 Tax=Thiothrix litoralis TaxID=2891210 RepID=A0ABX7WTJ4_9GAMM|nr:hypothetical protein [Thiothrix litoralis]QTR46596.1 hypothetical protein J9253_01150 [Thiothrix litoralis]
MHILVVFLVLLALIALVVWSFSQPKETLQAVWSEISSPFNNRTKDLATPLRDWAQTDLGEEQPLQTWLVGLPDEGLQALGESIANFCMEMDVELDWLFDPDAEVDPNAKAAAEEMVVDYCKICLKAVQNQTVTAS